MAHLKWLVVRDLNMIESATFWKDGPEIATGELRTEDIGTEVFFFPAAVARREGRLVHPDPADAAVAPQGGRAAGRLPQRAAVLLPARPQDPRAAGRLDRRARPPAARPHLGLPASTSTASPSAEAVLQEINGVHLTGDKAGQPLSSYTEMKADGSTTGGCWIYTGVYADGVNQAARRKPGSRAVLGGPGVGLGVAGEPPHPLQPRLGRPRGQAVERAQGATSGGTRSRAAGPATTSRTSRSTKPPSLPARAGARAGPRGWPATTRSSCRPTARAGCSRRPGCSTARCRRTTSRRSRRSATRSTASRPTRPGRCSRARTTC